MKRRKYIAMILLWASMWMLVVSVVPHHHHSFCAAVCMQHDADTDVAHHGDQNDDLCHSTCITRLRSVSPDRVQDHLAPDYTYFTDLFLWAEQCFTASMDADDGENPHGAWYHERLHAVHRSEAYGRRGPPAVGMWA
jgi:hypothetical protein